MALLNPLKSTDGLGLIATPARRRNVEDLLRLRAAAIGPSATSGSVCFAAALE